MSEGSSQPVQAWGTVVASDRSPPLSPALALPPEQLDGRGTVRPHQFSNSVNSPHNPLNRHATQDPRLESSDRTSASHVVFMLTSLEEVAAQRSMMAADQLGRAEPRAIRHATVEIHGRLPGQIPETWVATDNGDTNPADGRRVARFVDCLPPQNLVYGNRGVDSNHGQTMLTTTGITSFANTLLLTDSGDEESDGVTMAIDKDTAILYGSEVEDTLVQRDGHRVSWCTTQSSTDSNTTPASKLLTHSPVMPTSYEYPDSSQPTVNWQPRTPSYETGAVYQQHSRGQPSNIPEGWVFEHGPSPTAMHASDLGNVSVLDPLISGPPSLIAQEANPASPVFPSADTSLTSMGQYDRSGTQRPPVLSYSVDNYGNPMLAVASNQETEPIMLNAVAGTGSSHGLDLMDGHIQTSSASTISIVENSDSMMADTAPDSEMLDHSLPSAQDHDSINPSMLQQSQQITPISSQLLPGGFALQSNLDGTDVDQLDLVVDDFERNLNVSALLEHWTISYGMKKPDFPPVGERALRVKEWKRPDEVRTRDLNGDFCDPQGINWAKLGTTRETARKVRNKLYVNYTNIKHACPSEVSVYHECSRFDWLTYDCSTLKISESRRTTSAFAE